MAPTKRSRPTFSPPRPGKSKKPTTSAKAKSNKTASTGAKQRNGVKKSMSKAGKGRRPQDMVLVDSEAESESEVENVAEPDDENASDSQREEEDDDDDDEAEEESQQEEDDLSPEPSIILAEVTREDPSNKEKTKMSTDAREVVAKYVEVFVREAIMRSTFENSARNTSGAGWLEVEDLERMAVQLCLDF